LKGKSGVGDYCSDDSEHRTITQTALFVAAVRQMGGEEVVAKRLDSHYEPGRRSGAWSKKRINIGQELSSVALRRGAMASMLSLSGSMRAVH
jgi:ATP-dependent DNA ligase